MKVKTNRDETKYHLILNQNEYELLLILLFNTRYKRDSKVVNGFIEQFPTRLTQCLSIVLSFFDRK